MELSWDRRSDEGKIAGRLNIEDVQNFETSIRPLITGLVPQLPTVFPYLPRFRTLEFQGSLPSDPKQPREVAFTLIDQGSKEYRIGVQVDPTRTPMHLGLSLSEIEIPLAALLAYAPQEYSSLADTGTCVLQSLEATGPLGDWKSWEISLKTSVKVAEWEIPDIGVTLKDQELLLEGEGHWPNWSGNASFNLGSVGSKALPEPIGGIHTRDLRFSVNVADRNLNLSGGWSIDKAPGGSYSGNYSFSTETGYRVQGHSDRFNAADLGIDLKGLWSGSFLAVGDASLKNPPQLSLKVRGQGFRYGQFDFSDDPIEVELEGQRNSDESFSIGHGRALWGPNLQVQIRDCVASQTAVNAKSVEITGDLNRLMRFLPDGKVSAGWRNWAPPKGWRIESGIHVGLKPDLAVQAPEIQIDLGEGQVGRLSFDYSGQSKQWRLKTWPMRLEVNHLLGRFGVDRLEANGELDLQAEVSGNTRATETGGGSLEASVKGEVSRSDGCLRKESSRGRKGPYQLGWKNLNGAFEVKIGPQARSAIGDLQVQELGWYSDVPPTAKGSQTFSSVGAAQLKIQGEKDPLGKYLIHQCEFSEGNNNSIRVSVSGLVAHRGDDWLPQLDIQVHANNSSPILAAPGVEVGGAGSLNATVRPDRAGNWILEGEFMGEDFDMKIPARPVILEKFSGTLPIAKVRLDEYIYKERWALRSHPFPREPLGPDEVDRAYNQPGSQSPNVRMKRILVEDEDYRDFVGRMVMIDNIIYINSFTGLLVEGDFPLKGMGFLFIRPGLGAGMRIRGYSSKVPLSVGVPGLGPLGMDHDAVKVDWYNYQEPGQTKIETRHLYFDIPFGKVMKKVPAVGDVFFGWTPDSLEAYEMTLQKRKGGKYRVLAPGDTGEVPVLPQFSKTDENIGSPSEKEGGVWNGIKKTTRKVFRVDK